MTSEIERLFWRQRAKERYWAAPEKARQKSRRYRQENPRKVAAAKRAYRRRIKQQAGEIAR